MSRIIVATISDLGTLKLWILGVISLGIYSIVSRVSTEKDTANSPPLRPVFLFLSNLSMTRQMKSLRNFTPTSCFVHGDFRTVARGLVKRAQWQEIEGREGWDDNNWIPKMFLHFCPISVTVKPVPSCRKVRGSFLSGCRRIQWITNFPAGRYMIIYVRYHRWNRWMVAGSIHVNFGFSEKLEADNPLIRTIQNCTGFAHASPVSWISRKAFRALVHSMSGMVSFSAAELMRMEDLSV